MCWVQWAGRELRGAGWPESPDLPAGPSPRLWQQLPRGSWTASCTAGRSTPSSPSNATPAGTSTLRLLSCAPKRSSTPVRSPPARQTQRRQRPPCSDESPCPRRTGSALTRSHRVLATSARLVSGCLLRTVLPAAMSAVVLEEPELSGTDTVSEQLFILQVCMDCKWIL